MASREKGKNATASLSAENSRETSHPTIASKADLLQKTFDALTDAIFILDAEVPPKIVDCNKAASTIFGYAKDEMIGKTTALLHVDKGYLKKFQSLLYPAMEKNIISFHLSKYKMKRKDGSVFSSEHSVAQLLNNEGKRIGWVSLLRDITKHERIEEALRANEKKYRQLIETAYEGIWTLDAEAKITFANPRMAEMLGYTVDEIIGKPTFSFMDEHNAEIAKRHLEDRKRGIKEQYDLEFFRKDGTRLYVSIVASPITDDKGNYAGALAFMSDITERKKMEERLRQYSEKLEELVQKRTEELFESEKRYSILVEEAGDGVVIIQDEKITFVNKRLQEILGYSRDELIGLPFDKPIAEEYCQHAKERYMRILRGEKIPTLYEAEVLSKTGERVPVEISSAHVYYQGRPADFVIIRDVRERKRVEEQRSRLERLATIGEMATMVAHDLRNPLTSIRNASFYIKKTCPCRADAECKTALEMHDVIEKETITAANIINGLLEFASKRPLQKTRQNINELMEALLAESNIPKNINVEKNFAEKAIASIDKKQLARVFLNLIENSVQAMPNGGKLTVTISEMEDHIEITFADTGIGISEKNMSRIWEPFFTTKAKGIGIGLTITKKIVEQHGGKIDFKSKLGQGTTFIIKLPKKEEIVNDI